MKHFAHFLLACGSASGRTLRRVLRSASRAVGSSALRSVVGLFSLLLAATLPAQIADHAVRSSIAGVDVVVVHTGVKDVVTIRGSLPAGNSHSPADNTTVAQLTAGMLNQGTTKQDKYAITQKLDKVGAEVAFYTDADLLKLDAHCLSKDVPLVLSLIAEELRTPAFSPEEFAKLKKRLLGNYKRQSDRTDWRARNAFTQAVYPAGHPNRQPTTDESLAALDKATLEDVKAFYAQYYGPAAMRLVVVGDAEPAVVNSELTQGLAGWTGGQAAPRAAHAGAMDVSHNQTVFMPDKTSVTITWGQATGLKYGEPDYLALRVGAYVLGSGGFTSRLMEHVRDKEGLTYGIYAPLQGDTFNDGDFSIIGEFAPTLLEKGIASTQRQLSEWQSKGITAEELARTKTNISGTYQVGLATTEGMCDVILNMLNRGKDLAWVDQYPARINELSLADVNSSIKKHIKPDEMVLIKAGTVLEAPAKN